MLKLVTGLQVRLASLRDREEGQTLAEYAVVLALIVAVTAVVITTLGTTIKGAIENVTGMI